MPLLPRKWTRHELTVHGERALQLFVDWFKSQGNASYRRAFADADLAVRDLFEATNDLLDLGSSTVQAKDRARREAVRYLAGPPLSDDDLRTVAGVLKVWEPDRLDDLVRVVLDTIDPIRFEWLFREPRRKPTELTREVAIRWTAGLIAASHASTERRNVPSRRQERRVDEALAASNPPFVKVEPRPITSLRDLNPGEYCRQSTVGTTRADLSIALRDRTRLLALECKVSNSEVNSYKRLIHEVGNKLRAWQSSFGQSCLTGAVLAGAFSVDNLSAAQDAGIYLFWEHDLSSLVDFVQRAKAN